MTTTDEHSRRNPPAFAFESAVITGATGMIGATLAQQLVERGVRVYAVARPHSARLNHIPALPGVQVVECDLAALDTLPTLLDDSVDVFFHLGWMGTTGDTRNDARLQYENVGYALDAVGAAAALGCKVFVGAGSQAEYGRVEGSVGPETPAFPETCYGMGKLAAGQLTRSACAQAGIRHEWARILSVYGPRDVDTSMVSSTIDTLLQGTTPSFTPAQQLWDYLYCDDAAHAMDLIAARGVDGRVYCIGSGICRPLATYIEEIGRAVDATAPLGIGQLPYAPNQVMHLCADIELLTRDTGFTPEVPFDEGVARTVAWRKSNRREESR